MPVPVHMLASFRGIYGTAAAPFETWSFGLRITHPTLIGSPLPTVTMADACHTAAATLITNASLNFITKVVLQEVRLYTVGSDGKITDPPVISTNVDATGASAVAGQYPWQCTLAVTLKAAGLGKGRFGRFYLPTQNPVLGTDGLVASATVTTYLTEIRNFLAAVQSAARVGSTEPYSIAIIGGTGAAGTKKLPAEIRMGRVIDTQRRRRRSLGEQYVINAGVI